MNDDERCLKTHQAVQLPWFLPGIPWWLRRLGRLSCSRISEQDCQVELSPMRMTWLWRFPSKLDDWQARPAIKYGLESVPGWRTDAVSWEVSLGFWQEVEAARHPTHINHTHPSIHPTSIWSRTPQSLGLSLIYATGTVIRAIWLVEDASRAWLIIPWAELSMLYWLLHQLLQQQGS